ncbi:MAG TPA: hypothetical protein PLJ21_06025, partial [Pseudobdellovibrionaceae bacterium]|nr:hypothetical protein [Pseudobdellovibrionaceae bacterium]
ISVGHVNFWETGPKADQSYIYRSESLEDLNLLKLGEIAAGLLSGQVHPELISRISRLESYSVPIPLKTDFGWELTSAIYFEKKFPMIHQAKLRQIIKKAYQINEGIIENLKYYSQSSKPQSLEIVSSFEVLLDKLSLLNADLDPFFHWLTGEKVAIGPMPLKKVLEQTELVHRNFSLLLKPYLLPEELKEYHGTV